MSACRSCGNEVVWARTVNGKSMPVDPAPTEDGNVRLVYDRPGQAPRADVLGPMEIIVATDPLHLCHFATCPTAQEHRKP